MPTAREIMTPDATWLGKDATVTEAAQKMAEGDFGALPVCDGTDLVGMVSQADIARALPDAKVGDLVGVISEAPSNG